MQKFNLELTVAGLIPEFILQFFSTEHIKKGSLTCMELEDLRDVLLADDTQGLDEIKKFLVANREDEHAEDEGDESEDSKDDEKNDDEKDADSDEVVDYAPPGSEHMKAFYSKIDKDIAEVDDYYYNRFTAEELKYIFELIIDKIDEVYSIYKKETGMGLVFTIGFELDNERMQKTREKRKVYEGTLAVEFLLVKEKADEDNGNITLVPMKNDKVSDDIKARMYFFCNSQNKDKFEEIFNLTAQVLKLRDVH
ncbi:MAG: hypothetical protein WCJ46_05995 [bacterium]